MTKRWLDDETAYKQIAKAKAGWKDQYLPYDDEPDQGAESVLQSKIVKWCKDAGYPCLSFRQSKNAKGFLLPGYPDITIIIHNRVVFIELKSASGVLKEEQKALGIQLMGLGHPWYQIKSYKRFLSVMDKEIEKGKLFGRVF